MGFSQKGVGLGDKGQACLHRIAKSLDESVSEGSKSFDGTQEGMPLPVTLKILGTLFEGHL